MIQSILHRSLANFKHRAGLFVFMADGSLNAKSVEARRFVFMADRRLLAKSVKARRFVFMENKGTSARIAEESK